MSHRLAVLCRHFTSSSTSPSSSASSTRVAIANRGEIALRIAKAAREIGFPSVQLFALNDVPIPLFSHSSKVGVDEIVCIDDFRKGVQNSSSLAYTDISAIVSAAVKSNCKILHPGCGFLSESAKFAAECEKNGIIFVGPSPALLASFGNKVEARECAIRANVPVLRGAGMGGRGASLSEVEKFFDQEVHQFSKHRIIIKALHGGGGRGTRIVNKRTDLATAFERCVSEASAAFGNGDVFAEEVMEEGRHIEVQVIGDGTGNVVHLGERDCSAQRNFQKVVEMSPCPDLPAELRQTLCQDAVRLMQSVQLKGVATVEFLVDLAAGRHVFLEVNPRLQVEHGVTEMVTGLDIVQLQLRIATGASLASLGLASQSAVPVPNGFAVQLRISAETVRADGSVAPSVGKISHLRWSRGEGIRIDTAASEGLVLSPFYDTLLAKVIIHAKNWNDARQKALAALGEMKIEGVATNAEFVARIISHPDFLGRGFTTLFVDKHRDQLVPKQTPPPHRQDPVLSPQPPPRDGSVALVAPMHCTVVQIVKGEGEKVRRGEAIVILSAMKMEMVIEAPSDGQVVVTRVSNGDVLQEGQEIAWFLPNKNDHTKTDETGNNNNNDGVDLDRIRDDLKQVLQLRAATLDENRRDAVAKRHQKRQRTARENLADLVDPGSFVEYGALALPARGGDREELTRVGPADGLVCGVARINGRPCAVLAYDYTVFAGTQGAINHKKQDRLFEVAREMHLPMVCFMEGGGGRPGDLHLGPGLDLTTFAQFAALSGLVPRIGIVSGRCFAGNAVLLGLCDVLIACEDANIGMAGPAMIEGAGLGVCRPEDIGPIDVQTRNGVVDVAVKDEAEAVVVAKLALSWFPTDNSAANLVRHEPGADQRTLRHIVPENRKRVYDMHKIIDVLSDKGSVLYLRSLFGRTIITAMARIEGRPVGIVANQPLVLAGAIDADGADKGARFLQLCDAFNIPVLFLVDTPGFAVGPEAEKTALVRHTSRLFAASATLSVPLLSIIIRKSYGLGAMAMGSKGSSPRYVAAWPTTEMGAMGLEGAVRLGFKRQLEAQTSPEDREAMFQALVDEAYQSGKAINAAGRFEIDDVIDPADTRQIVHSLLVAAASAPERNGLFPHRKRTVDTW